MGEGLDENGGGGVGFGVTAVGKLGPALDDRLPETQSVACE